MSTFWKNIIGMGIYTAGAVTTYRYYLENSGQVSDDSRFFTSPTNKASSTNSSGSSSNFPPATFTDPASLEVGRKSYDLHYVSSKITSYPDWPKKGIVFRDIFPALRDPKALEMIISRFCNHVQSKYGAHNVDAVIGLDSRGFIFGPMIAARLGVAFVPVRKKGKLPGETIVEGFTKEYGPDQLEVQKGSLSEGSNVIVVDDLLATGGTLVAANSLLNQLGCNILENMVVIELDALKGSEKLKPVPVFSLLHYEE